GSSPGGTVVESCPSAASGSAGAFLSRLSRSIAMALAPRDHRGPTGRRRADGTPNRSRSARIRGAWRGRPAARLSGSWTSPKGQVGRDGQVIRAPRRAHPCPHRDDLQRVEDVIDAEKWNRRTDADGSLDAGEGVAEPPAGLGEAVSQLRPHLGIRAAPGCHVEVAD